MTTITELDLVFDFRDAVSVTHFDDDEYHVGSTVQRVDFIAEYDDRYHFIEVKDPDIPTAANAAAFATKLRSGKLVQSLAGKYRDTLFFRSVQGKTEKKIVYIVLLSMRVLDAAMLVAKQDELRRSIPLTHADWSRDSAATCIILNLEQWKRQFGDGSVRRLSEDTD